MAAVRPLLCEHMQSPVRRAYRELCPVCGSYWDVDSCAARVVYDAQYPEQRGHYDPVVGALKVRTLARWLRQGGIELSGLRVCEVGFGGGACLSFMADRARSVVGLEVNASAVERVRSIEPRAELLLVDQLPARLSPPVDLWLFQDSFEHIPNPAEFIGWLRDSSASNARVLAVLPRGDSLSNRLLGRAWPHKLPDHEFHWSRAGVVDFMTRRGFAIERDFYPIKFAAPAMFVAHARHKLGMRPARRRQGAARLALPVNFGEMGLVFRRAG